MYCTHCGNKLPDSAAFCVHCGGQIQRTPDLAQGEMAALVPVNITASSFLAGYLALFGLLLWPLGVFALGFGLQGLQQIKSRPTLAGRGRVWFGIVLGSLEVAALVVLCILLLL